MMNKRGINEDRNLLILHRLEAKGSLGNRSVGELLEGFQRSQQGLVDFLIRREIVADDDWALPTAIAETDVLSIIDGRPEFIGERFVKLIPAAYSRLHRLVAVSFVSVVAEDPSFVPTDTLRVMFDAHPHVMLATRRWIRQVQARVYGGSDHAFESTGPNAPWRAVETLDLWTDRADDAHGELARLANRHRSAGPAETKPPGNDDSSVRRHLRVIRSDE